MDSVKFKMANLVTSKPISLGNSLSDLREKKSMGY